MDMVPHLKGILRGGTLDVTLRFGTPIAFDEGADRKAFTRAARGQCPGDAGRGTDRTSRADALRDTSDAADRLQLGAGMDFPLRHNGSARPEALHDGSDMHAGHR